jgi:hypothetical protein
MLLNMAQLFLCLIKHQAKKTFKRPCNVVLSKGLHFMEMVVHCLCALYLHCWDTDVLSVTDPEWKTVEKKKDKEI